MPYDWAPGLFVILVVLGLIAVAPICAVLFFLVRGRKSPAGNQSSNFCVHCGAPVGTSARFVGPAGRKALPLFTNARRQRTVPH